MLNKAPCSRCLDVRNDTRRFFNDLSSSVQLCRRERTNWDRLDLGPVARSSTGSPMRGRRDAFLREQQRLTLADSKKDYELIRRFYTQPTYEPIAFPFPPKHDYDSFTQQCRPSCYPCNEPPYTFNVNYYHQEVNLYPVEQSINLMTEGFPENSLVQRRSRLMREMVVDETYCADCTEYLRLTRRVKGYSKAEDTRRSRILCSDHVPHLEGSVGDLIDMYVHDNMGYDWVSRLEETLAFVKIRLAFHQQSNSPSSKNLALFYTCVLKNFDHTLLQDATVLRLQAHSELFPFIEQSYFEWISETVEFD